MHVKVPYLILLCYKSLPVRSCPSLYYRLIFYIPLSFFCVMVPFLSSFIFQYLTETVFWIILCSQCPRPLHFTVFLSFFIQPDKLHFMTCLLSYCYKFSLSFSIIPCSFDYIRSQLLCFGSVTLAGYYSVHLPITLILPTSSSS